MLADILARGLTVVFVGTAKSTTSARAGHYYANPRNMFWNLLQATGLTEGEWLTPSDDRRVLEYGVGLTDLVPNRAASSDAQLRPGDYDVAAFIQKAELFEPMIVAFNGEKAATKVAQHSSSQAPIQQVATQSSERNGRTSANGLQFTRAEAPA
ncbi:MAG: mismatch-specific DNA-glycosylase [Actinomycetota bacterium]|nr:mismatch-specific DNA-glycosylase [Actinomycetota bacterium]